MNSIRTNLTLTLVTLVIFGVMFPVTIWAIGKIFPENASGNPVYKGEQLVGFAEVGQPFTSPGYFWGRPSAVNYDASSTGGSNYGTNNPDHIQEIKDRIQAFLEANPGITADQIPEELVTASGSGLDPHISVDAAKIQVQRVAAARNLEPKLLEELIDKQTIQPMGGIFGPGDLVNVLSINLALDEITSSN
ncbi:potassium-transporting ATPase subunit KdpC [Algoriphagus aestuariicola]|jgi:K+-transporting ATPase ATPase C chain|uniref:Potassium-transporting ATPase KdpC subunit n=1 Tax=Algoriphagus aestuariicola TaxID=1852016 RepID=A0ABS3BV00_9BACT|nr:potassium-transporting ATPase subunit KdpC [Algoriphagus aestuariicola]MBN7801539.1 potassium-transporting ATPase subunit KdpC [Algoriphagus aestuariicola]